MPEDAGDISSKNWGIQGWLRDSSALILSNFATLAATTALAVIIARTLQPHGFGTFSAILGLGQALVILVDMGLATYLLREFSSTDPGTDDHGLLLQKLVNSSVAFVAIAGFVTIAVAIAAAIATGTSGATLVALAALLIYTVVLAAATVVETIPRAYRKVGIVVIATLSEKCCLLALVIVVVFLGGGISAIAAAYLFAGVLHIAISMALTARFSGVSFSVIELSGIGRLVRESMPFALNRVSLSFIPRFDVLIVSAFSSVSAGYVAAGDRLVGAPQFIAGAMSSTLYPFLARQQNGSKHSQKAVLLLAASGVAIGAVGIIFTPELVRLLFGPAYEHGSAAVRVMVVSIPFIFISNGLLAHIYTAGRERTVALITAWASLAGTAVVVVGAYLDGANGAAIGYTLRQVLFTLLLLSVSVGLRRRGNPMASGLTPGRVVEPSVSANIRGT